MKETTVVTKCDWCHETTTNIGSICQYNIIGPNYIVLTVKLIDLHQKCEKEFYRFAAFLGQFTNVHIGLQKM